MDDSTNPFESPQTTSSMAAADEQLLVELSPALRRTGNGLALYYWAIIVMILCGVLFGFGTVSAAAGGSQAVQKSMQNSSGLLFVALWGITAGGIMALLGRLLCLFVPAESGARPLIAVSVAIEVFGTICAVADRVAPGQIPQRLTSVLGLVNIVGTLLFILFMRKLAEFVGRPDLARRAMNVVILSLVLCGVFILAFVAGPTFFVADKKTGPAMSPILAIPMFAVVIGGLVAFVMYANLIRVMAKLLRRKDRPKPA